ncbi:thrombospondin-1 like protein golden goal isoform X2 [Bombus fervidus]|uniref:thrombospondin-1 like protein golden goal isoform X2 n=1 Tax=Bombus fervidus TaxID=203811 RepID=UPI003AB1C471
MNLKFKWLFLGILVTILLEFDITRSMIKEEDEFVALKIDSPSSHVALSGDLTISVRKSTETLEKTKYKYGLKEEEENADSKSLEMISNRFFLLRVLYLFEDISELIGEIQLEQLPSGNETISIIIPCGYFTRGGVYALRVEYKYENSTVPVATLHQTSKILDVKWPLPTIFLESQQITTYPDKPVKATIRYNGVNCSPSDNVPVAVYILQLIYCGSSVTACYLQNNTYIQILYYEEIRDFLPTKTIFFRCELLGLPGNYAVRLKASNTNPTAPNTSVYFKVKWSEEFKLTVHARSIYPCEGSGGVAVLFEYPACRLEESDAAGWGPWSPWSPCSSSCFGGIRNRYRFCDTPPPKYGARFCQGKAIETEFCGKIFWQASSKNEEWHNRIQNSICDSAVLAATKPEVVADIGLQCRCGCRIVLKHQPFRKILGANTQACPGRSFWLLQAQANFIIGLHLDQLQFPCPGQYFRVRDGNSLNADLLIDVTYDKMQFTVKTLISSGQNLLLEFFSDELLASGDACIGGFLAHAAVLDKKYLKRNRTTTTVPFETNSTNVEEEWIFWKPAHLATALLLILIFIVSIFLTLQFIIKYRKYRIAEDLDSLNDVSELMPDRSKFLSTSTIISEVISMIETTTKSTPKETLSNTEDHYHSIETLTGCKDESTLSSSTLKLNSTLESSSDKTITSIKSNCDKLLSASSILVYHKPEVKYAYPVKLQTIDYDGSEEKELKMENGNLKDNKSNSISKIYQNNDISYSEGKESSPESVISSPSILVSGKETKERRNREKLLQGPGSEFSLTNPDSELELDYYDYNVANASAVPGSYLGMDPAFLVWIPPIEDLHLDTEDLLLGSKRNSILALETEGAALTPSEYRRMKLSSFEDFGFELEQGTRTFEKLLPVQKLLEDSSIKVSMESVSGILEHKQYCVISNRRVRLGKDEESSEESNSSKSLLGSPINMLNNDENNKGKLCSTPNRILQKDLSKIKQNCNQKIIPNNQDEDITNMSCKYKELMECSQSITNIKDTVNIPMTELSGSPLKSFSQVRKLNSRDIDASLNVQNPDYGIETFCLKQGSFYDQNIKFVDDDDDEYID